MPFLKNVRALQILTCLFRGNMQHFIFTCSETSEAIPEARYLVLPANSDSFIRASLMKFTYFISWNIPIYLASSYIGSERALLNKTQPVLQVSGLQNAYFLHISCPKRPQLCASTFLLPSLLFNTVSLQTQIKIQQEIVCLS